MNVNKNRLKENMRKQFFFITLQTAGFSSLSIGYMDFYLFHKIHLFCFNQMN